jgi:hypothetical protein
MAPTAARTIVMVFSSEPGTSLVAEAAALLALIAGEIEWVVGCRLAQGPRPERHYTY